ncbi:MAG: hypothetical protein K0R15_976 [Clostridiales bacterium]|nr:hypothetical protein [Clostridiales bacterium]
MEYILALVFLVFNSVTDIIKREICLMTVLVVTLISFLAIGISKDKILGIAFGIIVIGISRISKSFGTGDAIIILTIGFLVGLIILLKMLMYASILASIFGAILLFAKKGSMKSQLPFVPFMLVGYIMGVLL